MLKGKLVTLRPVRRSDISLFIQWFNDPEVTQYLLLYLPMTEMAEEKWIEETATHSDSDIVLVIEANGEPDNIPIGTCGLHRIHQKDRWADFGIAIGEKQYWEKGYGTEAARLIIDYGFNQLNLHRIHSSAFAFNERSIALHKKLGFQEEGRERESMFKNGQYHDMVLYGLLRDEWK